MAEARRNALDASKRCAVAGCAVRATYVAAEEGASRPALRFCGRHRTAEAVSIKKSCETEGCGTGPGFGLPGGKPRWCLKHKPAEAVNVRERRCEMDGCEKFALCRGAGGAGPKRWCVAHRPEGSALPGRRCSHKGCCKVASYASASARARKWCAQHAPKGTADVRNKRCKAPGCTQHAKQPDPDSDGKGKVWCTRHRRGAAAVEQEARSRERALNRKRRRVLVPSEDAVGPLAGLAPMLAKGRPKKVESIAPPLREGESESDEATCRGAAQGNRRLQRDAPPTTTRGLGDPPPLACARRSKRNRSSGLKANDAVEL